LNYYEIGQRIRKFRKAQGLSQECLAELVDISTTHMSHIETGNTKLSLHVLVDIAQVLHASTDELLFAVPETQKRQGLAEIQEVLDACSPKESKIIATIIKSAKIAMDQYK